jgi:hypothetical protein
VTDRKFKPPNQSIAQTERKFKPPNQSIAQEIDNQNATFIAVDPKSSPQT